MDKLTLLDRPDDCDVPTDRSLVRSMLDLDRPERFVRYDGVGALVFSAPTCGVNPTVRGAMDQFGETVLLVQSILRVENFFRTTKQS